MTQSRRNRWIMGSAIGLAAVATAIDHTRHSVPQAVETQTSAQSPSQEASPCGLGGNEEPNLNPCSLGGSNEEPNVSPCSLE